MGDVLDAGAGPDSLKWLASCQLKSITGVTADYGMQATINDQVGDYLNPRTDRVVVGNWQNTRLLQGRGFDVVLADYLLGSVEHFSPHFQVDLLRRLAGHIRPNGWLAIVGKEPEDLRAEDPASQLILDADALRDAAMTLGRQRPYRELPQWWVAERLRGLGLQFRQGKVFPRRVTTEKVMRQLAWAEEELQKVPHAMVQLTLLDHLADLRERVQESTELQQGHTFGSDYAMLLQRADV